LPEVSQKVAQKLLQKSQKLLSVTKVAKKAKITQNAKVARNKESCSKYEKFPKSF